MAQISRNRDRRTRVSVVANAFGLSGPRRAIVGRVVGNAAEVVLSPELDDATRAEVLRSAAFSGAGETGPFFAGVRALKSLWGGDA
jgi:hypothetical protein